MSNISSVNSTDQSARPQFKVQRSPFYGQGDFVWAVYPNYWKDAWGRIPLMGLVSADDAFTAERVAFDVGLPQSIRVSKLPDKKPALRANPS